MHFSIKSLLDSWIIEIHRKNDRNGWNPFGAFSCSVHNVLWISWAGIEDSSSISRIEYDRCKFCRCTLLTNKLWIIVNTFNQIFGAIAVPLSDRKNVFVSYNFEANYNSPFMASDFYPGFYNRVSAMSDSISEHWESIHLCFLPCSITAGYKKFGVESVASATQLGDTTKLLHNYWKQTERVCLGIFILNTSLEV